MYFAIFSWIFHDQLKLASFIGIVILIITVADGLLYIWSKNRRNETRAGLCDHAVDYVSIVKEMYGLHDVAPSILERSAAHIFHSRQLLRLPYLSMSGLAIYNRANPVKGARFCFFLTGVSSLMSKMLFGLFHYEDFNRLKLASLIGMVILTIIVAITLLYMWYKNQKEEMRAWRRRRAARYTPALIDMYPLYGIPPPPYSKDCTPIRKPNHIAIYPAFMVRGRKELRRKDLKISPVKNSKIKDNATPKQNQPPGVPTNVQFEVLSQDTIYLWWNPPADSDQIVVRGYTVGWGIFDSIDLMAISLSRKGSTSVKLDNLPKLCSK
ncbi:hypothetical protein T11_1770 [Trichinella zimbabwensis]|uniref:Fibronectin type-III domain-containing protein n=1 Tax=Trichinella zimbabwensis TaxID=268475 RepID=A0A0V1GSI1_9BILA|nr:hypothetical protein T11_10333 [Trichinella zimbabwensis]KRZ01294.1 hypothetical protein T11_10313 [Trichinella zimbabwensis]KRZ07078.1 hypothetical protein T11_1770 [Trichinella zimbabwensis]